MRIGERDGWARARFRLRDLRGRDRLLAIGLMVLVLVPFAAAFVRALRDGWVPNNDEARIAIRSLDVFSRHPPLTGLPSSSELYGDKISTSHPGPFEFYLMAVPLRIVGMSAGPLLTAAVINAGCGLIVLWVFFRRLGLTAMLWAGVLFLAVVWSGGNAVLTDTLSSNMPMYSLLATAVLAWAVIDSDLRLLPLAAFVASYAAQQHLAAGIAVMALTVVVIVALAVQITTRVRHGDKTVGKTARRWSLAAFAVTAVCWAPVVYDQFTGHPGNLTAISRLARDSTRPTVGFKSGVYQALHAVTPPTILGRTNTTGLYFLEGVGHQRFALGVVVALALVVLAWWARVRSTSVALLAVVALALLAAGIINGSNVPASTESLKVNLYRSWWTPAFLTWTALGIGVALLAGRTIGQRAIAVRAKRLAPVVLLVVAALITTSIAFANQSDDQKRDLGSFAPDTRVGDAVLAKIDRRHAVVVVWNGLAADLSIAPYVIFRLIEAGMTVEVPKAETEWYGHDRGYRPEANPSAVVISSGLTKAPSGPGTLIALERFAPERVALLHDLSTAALGKRFELVPGAHARMYHAFPTLPRNVIDTLFARLPSSARGLLEQPAFLTLVLNGIFSTPTFDKTKIQRLLHLSAKHDLISYEEQVEVHLLSPDQVRAALPGLR